MSNKHEDDVKTENVEDQATVAPETAKEAVTKAPKDEGVSVDDKAENEKIEAPVVEAEAGLEPAKKPARAKKSNKPKAEKPAEKPAEAKVEEPAKAKKSKKLEGVKQLSNLTVVYRTPSTATPVAKVRGAVEILREDNGFYEVKAYAGGGFPITGYVKKSSL